MSLRGRISLTAWLIRLLGCVTVGLGAGVIHPGLGMVAVVGWLIVSGSLLRELVLPWLFPSTTCPGCRRRLSLFGRWKCGDHYTDHQERHVLAFYCAHGHRLEGFDCPRCRATILVQRGEPQRVRHGSAVRLRILGNLPRSGIDALLLGHDEHRRGVALPYDRLAWHMAITGGTGRGKSTMLANMAVQLAAEGAGFTILDPGGDLVRLVLQHIPPEREEDVLYVDVADREHPFPLNILHAQDEVEGAVLTEELLGVFHKLHGSDWGPLLSHQLRMALRAAMLAQGTLRDVYSLFIDQQVRARIVGRVRDPDVRAFWTKEFPTIPAMRHSAVTNKLAPIVLHPVLGRLLCAQQCAVHADAIIRQEQILLVNLNSGSPGDDVTTLLGTFLVQKILAAAFRQSGTPEHFRTRHVLIVDEFQRFMHRAAAFDQILAESRKFKLALVVANQFMDQLSPEVRAALLGNVGCLCAFRVGHHDARILAPEFRGSLPEDLMELERGECLLRVGTDWTSIRALPPLPRLQNNGTDRILQRSWSRTANTPQPAMQGKEAQDEPISSDDFVQ